MFVPVTPNDLTAFKSAFEKSSPATLDADTGTLNCTYGYDADAA